MAYEKIGELENALSDLKSAYNLDPKNTVVIEEL